MPESGTAAEYASAFGSLELGVAQVCTFPSFPSKEAV